MRARDLMACLLLPCGAAPAASTPAAFHLTPQGAIVVPVVVNGARPVPFILDTGSNTSVVSDDLASALGAPVVARTTMASAGGQRDALVARIEHLEMGGVRAHDLSMAIVPRDALDLPGLTTINGLRAQGIIGQDVLSRLRYTIDYRKRHIVWHDAGAPVPRRATVLDLQLQEDRFLVVLPQSRGVLRLVPDSGAETLVLFHEDGRGQPDVIPSGAPVGLTGLAGTRKAQPAIVRTLHIGSAVRTNMAALVVESEHASPSVDGLLPLHIFARVTFDGPGRQLLIEDR
jgi:predicted aspartyl protease